MISLSRHIECLLLNHDCVIVPGLGGFVTRYVEARYVPEEDLFLPPCRTVGFNARLTMNDGLLVQSFMQAYDTGYPETVALVDEAVQALRHRLQEEGRYELPSIGTLSLGIDGQYEFTPCEAGVISPELYGLDALYNLKPLAATPKQQPAKAAPRSPRKHRVHLNRSERSYTLSVNREAANYLVAALVALVSYFMWITPLSTPEDLGVPQTASMAYERLFAAPTRSTAKPRPTTPAPAKGTPAPAAAPAQPEAHTAQSLDHTAQSEVQPTQPQGRYSLVVASSIPRDNAAAYARQLQTRGWKEARVYQHRKMVRVVYGQYATELEARTALQSLRTQAPFTEAWVIEMK
ncbi:MAG: SPOR domain-containing protein [Rothia sp. (in: high G+C Gram-positive bacteria)]|uniref:HU domain-containing protein n=1 Tax=Rothia sp. (in: high G+C Gram-positive bacteria) TaxID=1885016 RepID=UPI0026DF2C22|nr:SPOR domain-containing protein [Rothia sp. (in: high G+C Gram-positive bacteria)]MDO5751269.1 SPOR domain-containing protein [Rothia sp. (in: high G+C Gram-positive bacteria)]